MVNASVKCLYSSCGAYVFCKCTKWHSECVMCIPAVLARKRIGAVCVTVEKCCLFPLKR